MSFISDFFQSDVGLLIVCLFLVALLVGMGIVIKWMTLTTRKTSGTTEQQEAPNNDKTSAAEKTEPIIPAAAEHHSSSTASRSLTRLAIGTTSLASLLLLFITTISWTRSLLSAIPTQGTVLETSLELIDNDWWEKHFGSSYQIGSDDFNDNFCVPYEYYALVTLEWSCPLFPSSKNSCRQGQILAWDCGLRQVCREDCQALVDDGQEIYQCDYNGNGNEDADSNEDDGEQQQTEEEILECVQNTYPINDVVDIVSDCTSCSLAISKDDYFWVKDQENYGFVTRWGGSTDNSSSLYGGLMLGCLLAVQTIVLYRKSEGGAKELFERSDDEDDGDNGGDYNEWRDEGERCIT